jgi:anti-sigma regulatory factor (Ser/Thr protein kinase)
LANHVLTDREGLSAIRKEVRSDLSSVRVDPAAAFDCLVALTEACTQALAHSDVVDGRHPQVSWEIGDSEALFFIRDFSSKAWARASHPSSAPIRDDDLDTRLEDLGLQLMSGLMDDVRIEMHDSGTTIVLVKRYALSS